MPSIWALSGFSYSKAPDVVYENIAGASTAIAIPAESDLGSTPPISPGGIPYTYVRSTVLR